MSTLTLGLIVGVLVAAVVTALFESYRVAYSACQFFFALLRASFRPAGGSSAEPRPSKDGAAVDHHDDSQSEQPIVYRSSHGRLLSSHLPARSTADLESAGDPRKRPRRRFSRPPIFQPRAPFVVALPTLAAIDPAPNLGAFGAGVELGIFTALFTISSLLLVNWIVKTMRSSN